MILEFIVYFIGIVLAGAIGFWLGLRSQKEQIIKDTKKTLSLVGERLNQKPGDHVVGESGIIKALTPDQLEEERKQKFEKENY